jgi:hypothetical protein
VPHMVGLPAGKSAAAQLWVEVSTLAHVHAHTHTHTHTVNTRPHTRKHTRAEAGGHAEGGGQVCKCRFEPFPGQVARLLAGRVVLVRVDLSVNVKVMLGKVTWLYIPLGGI